MPPKRCRGASTSSEPPPRFAYVSVRSGNLPPCTVSKIVEIRFRDLNKLVERLPDLNQYGKMGKFLMREKITESVTKVGHDFTTLVQNFIVRSSRSLIEMNHRYMIQRLQLAGIITEEVLLSDLRQKRWLEHLHGSNCLSPLALTGILLDDDLTVNNLSLASARHSSSSKKPCLPGTRTAVRHAIMSHLNSPSFRYVLLHGPPGTGKSAIAMSLAMELEKEKRLAASFFFDLRIAQDPASTLAMFVTTLARQISRFDASYHRALVKALKSNPEIVKDSLQLQFQGLLIDPWHSLKSHETTSPIPENGFHDKASSSSHIKVIIIDALDECGENASDFKTFLDLIALFERLPPNYRVFCTSRPDSTILQRFPFGSTGAVEDLEAPDYQASAATDLFQFIHRSLHEISYSESDRNWPPPDDDVAKLSSYYHGQFELAAFHIRRIENAPLTGLPPRDVFEAVQRDARDGKVDGLETTYLQTLERTYSHHQGPDFDRIVGVYRYTVGVFVSLQEPLTLSALARFLNRDEYRVRLALQPLSSTIFVDPNSLTAVRCYHITFREFLLSNPRGATPFHHNFLFNGPQHILMFRLCVERMDDELRVGILPETSEYDAILNIPNFGMKVSKVIPTHLRYCCLYWSYHLNSITGEDVTIQGALGVFFEKCLLNWIEAMSLLGELDKAIPMLLRTINWYQNRVCCSRISRGLS